MLKRINDILPELILEIFIYGLVVQFIGVWFVEDKLLYSTGLWFGIAIAMGMAVNMAVVILDTVDNVIEKRARLRSSIFSVIRYIVIIVLFSIVAYFRLGNVVTMFLGVMGLKAAAYFWPFTHKISEKLKKGGKGKLSADQGR